MVGAFAVLTSLNCFFAKPQCIKLCDIKIRLFYFHPVTVLTCRNSSNPQTPPSRPLPHCLNPPKGVPGSAALPLIQTHPDLSFFATL